MLATLIKKKLTNNQVANIFINTLFESIDKGFPDVAHFINEDVAFVRSPAVDIHDSCEFSLIVIVGNLSFLERVSGDIEHDKKLKALVLEKLSAIYQMTPESFGRLVKEYNSFIRRINFPSKNIIYGMSRAVFYKYQLNAFQDDYFMRLNTPNPLFLKRLDEVMESFLWNWEAFLKKYRIN